MNKAQYVQIVALSFVILGSLSFISSSLNKQGLLAQAVSSVEPVVHFSFDDGAVAGKIGNAREFDGIDDFFQTSDDPSTENIAAITVSAWVKPGISDGAQMNIVGKARSGQVGRSWVLYRSSSEKYTFEVGNGTMVAIATSDVVHADTEWHLVTGVYDGSTVKIYVDGQSRDSTPPALSGNVADSQYYVCVSGYSGSSGPCGPYSVWNGAIDDVRIYNRALAPDEITSLYTSAGGTVTPTTPTTPTQPTSPSDPPPPPPANTEPLPPLPKAAMPGWTAPIGIPHPGFGIEEQPPARPTNWSSEIPGYYYVNNETGTDSANVYGTPLKPKLTIPDNLPPGSYVEIHGNYTKASGGNTFIKGSGTPGQWIANTSGPVWVVGDPTNMPTFTQSVLLNGSYLYVDSVRFAPKGVRLGSASVDRPADHIVVRNSEVRGDSFSAVTAVSTGGRATGKVTNVLFYNNKIHDFGDMNTTLDQDAAAATVGGFSSNIWFLNNEMYRTTAGVRVGGAYDNELPEDTHHVYFGHNTIHDILQNGLAVKYAQDIVFSDNHIYNITDNGNGLSPGKGIGAQYGPRRLWILYNTIHRTRFGVAISSTNTGGDWPIYMIGNVIYDIYQTEFTGGSWDEAGMRIAGGSQKYVLNNTIYKAPSGINVVSGTGAVIENNSINNITESAGKHLYVENNSASAVIKNNHFYQNGAPIVIRLGGTSYTVPSLLAKGNCSGCIDANPLFENAAAFNFRLTSGSPLINTGSAESALYAQYQQTFGVDIRKDIAKTSRPQAGAWDIGAYEYTGTVSNPPPTSPVVGDINGDGKVNTFDFSEMNRVWNLNDSKCDLNKDGAVNTLDYSILVRNWTG